MFIIPRWADFWRPWLVTAALGVALMVFFLEAGHAHAAGGHHHHRRRAHHAHAMHHRFRRFEAARFSPTSGRDAVAIAMRYVGGGNPTGSHHAWCGDFVNMTERLAGRPGMASGALASAWRFYGHATRPVRNAIAVMRGHVSRVIAVAGDRVTLISGNWSHRVSIHVARIREILAFRTF